ncbi:MAG: S8 family peptidase [Flavobacteriales bacterium]|nr:S8 family peptidase [Flavobacteriales bacterium]
MGKAVQAPQSNWIAEATKCAATEDGGVIVVGTVFDGTSNNFQTLKYSAIGELEWEKKYDALEGNDKALGLLVDGDRVYVNGISNNGTGNKYTTMHYTDTERVHDMIYSAEGAPICKADEMIIRLRPEFVNTSVADNKGWQYGTLDEVVSSAVADQIAEKAGHGPLAGKSTKVYKVFRHTTRADSISRTRLGREEEIPTVWCTFLIEADLGANIQATVDSVSTLSDQLEFAQLNLFYPFLCDVCEDPLLDRQPNLFPSTEYPNADINVQQAWDLTQAIPEVKVGIVDQFVDYEHEDFNECATNGSSIVDGHDFMANYNWIFWQEVPDYPSHGTASAGIIGAIRNNCIGIAGIAGKDAEQPESGCTLYTIGIADQSFYGSFSDVIAPALYSGTVESNTSEVTFGCNVLNNGYGVNGQFAIDFALREAIRACYRNECVFVAARGNGGGPPHYPADFSSSYNDYAVLAVGASGPDGSRMTPTNGGVYLTAGGDLIAPGYQGMVTSTINAENDFVFTNECTPLPDPYSCFRWSSAAAPHASGVAALMQSTHHPAVGSLNGLAPEDVEIIMEKAATDIGSSYGYPDGPDDFNGYGRLNAGESVRLVKTPYRVFHSGPPITTDVTVMTTQTVSMPGISQGWAFTWGLPPGDYEMTEHRFELTYTNTFEPNTEILDGWGRNSSVFGNLDPHFDHTAEWEFAIDGNSANVVGRTSCWKVTNGPDGPMQFWIPVDPSKISTPYSLHLYEEIISSVAEAESNSFALYPNPATTELRIAFNGIAARRLEVVDITGRIVKTEAIAVGTPNIEISIAHLAQGTYSLRVTGTNGGHTQRFIKY